MKRTFQCDNESELEEESVVELVSDADGETWGEYSDTEDLDYL